MNPGDYATETKERAVTEEVDGQPATTQIKLKDGTHRPKAYAETI
jgi:hypothetical protein